MSNEPLKSEVRKALEDLRIVSTELVGVANDEHQCLTKLDKNVRELTILIEQLLN